MMMAVAEEFIDDKRGGDPEAELADSGMVAIHALVAAGYLIALRRYLGKAPIDIALGASAAMATLLLSGPGFYVWGEGRENIPWANLGPILGWGVLASSQHGLLAWGCVRIGPLSTAIAVAAGVPVTVVLRTFFWEHASPNPVVVVGGVLVWLGYLGITMRHGSATRKRRRRRVFPADEIDLEIAQEQQGLLDDSDQEEEGSSDEDARGRHVSDLKAEGILPESDSDL